MDDVNVAKDVALCRRCAEPFSYADLIANQEVAQVDLMNPPKGTWFKQDGSSWELGCTTRSPVAFFLIPFVCLWSGGSMWCIYGTQFHRGHFYLSQSLFGIPFLIGTLVLVPAALMTMCGKFYVRVESDEGRVFTGIGPLGWSRRFRWSEVREVREWMRKWQRNDRNLPMIELDGPKPIRFGSGLTEPRRLFFLAALRRMHSGRR